MYGPGPNRPGGHDPSLREDTRWRWLPHLVKPRAATGGPAAWSAEHSKESFVFIGFGTIILIAVIVLVVLFVRRH